MAIGNMQALDGIPGDVTMLENVLAGARRANTKG